MESTREWARFGEGRWRTGGKALPTPLDAALCALAATLPHRACSKPSPDERRDDRAWRTYRALSPRHAQVTVN